MFVSCLSYGFKLLQYFEFKINCLQLNMLTNKYVCILNLDVAKEILLGWGSYEVSHSELPSKEPLQGAQLADNLQLPPFLRSEGGKPRPQLPCVAVIVQSLSCVWLFETSWTMAHQASLSLTLFQSLPKFMSIESVMLPYAGIQETWFDPWVGKIPWRRKCQSIPIFLPGELHGQRSLAGYSPWGRKELDMTERLTLTYFLFPS